MPTDWLGPVALVLSALLTGIFGFLAGGRGEGALKEFRRRKIYRKRGKLRHVCPHVVPNETGTESLIVEFLTELNQCRRCGREFLPEDEKEIAYYWAQLASKESIESLDRRTKKAERLVRQLDSLGNWKKEIPD